MVNHCLTNQQKSSLEPRIWFITHNKIPTICYIAIIPNLFWTDLEENVRFAWSRNKVGGQKGKGRLPRRTSATWKVSFASRFWSFRPSCDWPLRSFDGSRLMTRWVDGRLEECVISSQCISQSTVSHRVIKALKLIPHKVHLHPLLTKPTWQNWQKWWSKTKWEKNINDGNARNAGQIGDLENYYLFEHRGWVPSLTAIFVLKTKIKQFRLQREQTLSEPLLRDFAPADRGARGVNLILFSLFTTKTFDL